MIERKYEERDIQNLFDSGAITSVRVRYFGLLDWNISFVISGHDDTQSVYTQRGNIRSFKTLDAASKFLTRIGFRKFDVYIG